MTETMFARSVRLSFSSFELGLKLLGLVAESALHVKAPSSSHVEAHWAIDTHANVRDRIWALVGPNQGVVPEQYPSRMFFIPSKDKLVDV